MPTNQNIARTEFIQSRVCAMPFTLVLTVFGGTNNTVPMGFILTPKLTFVIGQKTPDAIKEKRM